MLSNAQSWQRASIDTTSSRTSSAKQQKQKTKKHGCQLPGRPRHRRVSALVGVPEIMYRNGAGSEGEARLPDNDCHEDYQVPVRVN